MSVEMIEFQNLISYKKTYKCLSIGLIGQIGAGKTTLRVMLEKQLHNDNDFFSKNIKTIDADSISRQIYEKNDVVYEQLIKHFGNKILDENDEIDRKILAEIVFSDSEQLKYLESVTHEKINSIADNFLKTLEKNDVGIYESTKMLETNFYKKLDIIICISSQDDYRHERLKSNRNMIDNQIRLRENRQKTDSENIKFANIIIKNNSSIFELEKDVEQLKILFKEKMLEKEKLIKEK